MIPGLIPSESPALVPMPGGLAPPPSLFKTLCPKIEATGTSSVQKGISTQWLNYYTWHSASSDKTHGGGGLVAKLCLTLVTTWTVAHQAPLP